jgi:hypothetical protein
VADPMIEAPAFSRWLFSGQMERMKRRMTMRRDRNYQALLALILVVIFGIGLVIAAEDSTEPCGSTQPSVEGPPFNPENVCTSDPPSQVGLITDPDIQQPDESAWRIFSEINRPDHSAPFWRSWPEQAEVYPAVPNPANPPKWKAISGPEPFLRARPSVQQRILRMNGGANAAVVEDSHPCTLLNQAQKEEVRINEHTFDYLIANDLWYVQGKAKAFATDFVVNFPTNAREVKANWIPISASQKGSFVTTVDSKGQLWGLVAFHIASKEVPNWLWATFEHASNPCYSKYLKAQDRFGLTSNDKVSPELIAMFKKYNLDVGIYSNYRLDGAQVNFTDPTGRPIILGNSVTEFGFQTTASCMTCHARSTTDQTGTGFLPVFNQHNQSDHGTPDPSWYFSSFNPLTRSYMPLDFLWSVALCPNAVGTTTQNCSLPPVDQ